MKSKFVSFLYLFVPIVFLFGIAIEFIQGGLPGTQWHPIITAWPLILLAFLYIIFSIKARGLLYSSTGEKVDGEVFWKSWAGILWILWAFYIAFAYFIPDPTHYFIELPDLTRDITTLQFVVILPLGLFVQFNSHRYLWRFLSFGVFVLQGVMFLLDHWVI